MNRTCVRVGWVLVLLVALPFRAPAPLIYRQGEGWTYEMPGTKGDWRKARAKEQLDFAQQAFDKKKYGLALKAAKRLVDIHVFGFSDYAAKGQYLMARCLVSCLDCQTSGNKDVVKLVAQLACLLGHLIDAREKGGICCHASGHCLHITQQLETQVKQAGEPIWHG